MARLLAAKGIPLLAHALEYVSVAYGGFFYIYAKFLHAQFKAKIGKHGNNKRIVLKLPFFLHIFSADAHYPVAINNVAHFIRGYHPVCIAIKSKACIRHALRHKFLQAIGMCGAAKVVYITAVRLIGPGYHLCAKFAEYVGCYI